MSEEEVEKSRLQPIIDLIETYGFNMYRRGVYESDKKMKRHWNRQALATLKIIKEVLNTVNFNRYICSQKEDK